MVTELARGLASRGHHVEVWTQRRHLRRTAVYEFGGVQVTCFASLGSERYPVAARLFGHVRKNAPKMDLVHGHNYHAASFLASGQALGSAPLVLTPYFHGTGHTRVARAVHPVYRQAAGRLIAKADALVAGSEAEHSLLASSFPRSVPLTTRIVNAVSIDDIRAASPYDLPQPIVLCLGRLEKYKRVDLLLEAWQTQAGNARLVIIGDGADRRRIRQLAAKNLRSSSIEVLGELPRAEVARWLRTADVVVSLSQRESFGIVAWEAAAAGASLLLADIPAFQEIKAFLPDVDIRLTSSRLAEVRTALAPMIGQARNQGPREIRAWDEVVSDYESLYQQVLAKN